TEVPVSGMPTRLMQARVNPMANPANPGAAARPVTSNTTSTSSAVSTTSTTKAPPPLIVLPQPFVPNTPVRSVTPPQLTSAFSAAPLIRPPSPWASTYVPASTGSIRPDSSTPRVTAGLTWHPDTGPIVYANANSTSPNANETPTAPIRSMPN